MKKLLLLTLSLLLSCSNKQESIIDKEFVDTTPVVESYPLDEENTDDSIYNKDFNIVINWVDAQSKLGKVVRIEFDENSNEYHGYVISDVKIED